jgi:HEAT repeat protein
LTGQDDVTRWQHWWALNQGPYLQLKSFIYAGGPVTGQGDGTVQAADERYRVSPATVRKLIIPNLLNALRTESSNDIQSSCMIALAKIGDPDDGTGRSALVREVQLEIQKRLVSSSQELSETAAIAFGILGHRENIGLLTAVLENDAPRLRALGVPQTSDVGIRTRAFAAYGLGLIGNQAAEYDRLVVNETLRRLLDGECRGMAHRDVPVACLTAMGLTPLAIDPRDNGLEQEKTVREKALMMSRQDQLRFLLGYFADESCNSLNRAHAPTAMARLLAVDGVPDSFGFKSAVAEALLATLAESSKADTAVQQSAILALGLLGDCDEDGLDRRIRSTLMQVKERLADQQARRFAVIALAQAAGRPGRGNGDPLDGVSTKAPQANARSYLLGELARDKGTLKPWIGIALAVLERSLDDAQSASSMDVKLALRASLVESRSPDDLGAFAIACGIVRDVGAKDTLLKYVRAVRDTEARGHTAIALGMLRDTSAIAPLEEIARTSKYQGDLMRSAVTALGLLGDKALVPELIEMLAAANSLSSQAAISRALGTVGDSRSVTALVEFLNRESATELARAFGAVALGLVAEKEDLPWNAKIGIGSNYRANTPSLIDGKGGVLDIL